MQLTPDQQARLAKLNAARDELITGCAVSEVEYAGERTTYARADMARLDREIDKLTSGYGTVRIRL